MPSVTCNCTTDATEERAASDKRGHLLEMSHSAQWGWNTMPLSWQHTASAAHTCDAFHRRLTVEVCGTGVKSRTLKLLWHEVFMKDGWVIAFDVCQMATESCHTPHREPAGRCLTGPTPDRGHWHWIATSPLRPNRHRPFTPSQCHITQQSCNKSHLQPGFNFGFDETAIREVLT